jgi:hypothetical protein
LLINTYVVDTKSGEQLADRMLGNDNVIIVMETEYCQLDFCFGTCGGIMVTLSVLSLLQIAK